MNYRLTVALAMASGLFACQQHDVNSGDANAAVAKAVAEETTAATIEPVSGLDFDGFDTAVRPQDDLFAAVEAGADTFDCKLLMSVVAANISQQSQM